jgi:hypothetical protein
MILDVVDVSSHRPVLVPLLGPLIPEGSNHKPFLP